MPPKEDPEAAALKAELTKIFEKLKVHIQWHYLRQRRINTYQHLRRFSQESLERTLIKQNCINIKNGLIFRK